MRTQQIPHRLRRERTVQNSARTVSRRLRRSVFQVESLEGRRLLAAVLFADALASTSGVVSTEGVAVDGAGNTYITGAFTGQVALGPKTLTSLSTNTDMFVAKVAPNGTVLWAQRMGSASVFDGDFGRSVAVDTAGNVYVAGFFAAAGDVAGKISVPSAGGRDVVVAKFDTNGNPLWAKSFGGPGADMGQGVAVDNTGNLYVTGSFNGTARFGGATLTSAGFDDIFVARLSAATGTATWARSMGGPGQDFSFSVSVDGAGNVFTTGDFGFGSFSPAKFGPFTLIPQDTVGAESDIFVQKMDSNGNVQWARGYGGSGHDSGISVVSDGSGGAYVTGDIGSNVAFGSILLSNAGAVGSNDAFVARFSSSGTPLWAKNFGGPGFDAGFGITRDAAGNVYATGIFQGTGSFPRLGTVLKANGGSQDVDVYLVKMDPAGNVFYAQSFGSTTNDQVFQVAVGGPNHAITMVGEYAGAINLSTYPYYYALPKQAALSSYVVQLTETPTIRTTKVVSDFDATGKTELAYYEPATQQWWVRGPGNLGRLMATFTLGNGSEVPITGDFLKLGRPQIGMYDTSTGNWWVDGPNGKQYVGTFGDPKQKDIPVPGDYLGAGSIQLAFYRPTTGQWYVQLPTAPYYRYLGTMGNPQLNDVPVPGNYDATGRAELAIYRPTTGQWIVQGPKSAYVQGAFGAPNMATGFGEVPIPGDYDGIGRTQAAVWQPTSANWYVSRASGRTLLGTFGSVYYYDVPTQAVSGSLLYFHKISGSAAPGSFGPVPSARSMASTPSGGTVTAAAATGTGTPSSTVVKTAALGTRSAVVAGQGGTAATTRNDLVSAALQQLYRG
jgi:hypothetical protein